MAASTISVFKNWWILAGSNVTVPTYFDTGNISVIGDNQVDLLGYNVTLGAQTDVDIGALNNINMLAGSSIQMSAPYIYTSSIQTINTTENTFFTGNVNISSINSFPNGWCSSIITPVQVSTYHGPTLLTPTPSGAVVTFPYNGYYSIRRKLFCTKTSGGASQIPNVMIMLSQTSNAPTLPADDVGYSSLPFFNELNRSTFTTVQTVIHVVDHTIPYIGYWYDDVGANYYGSFGTGALYIEYMPPPT